MKIIKAILMMAVMIGVASLFANSVAAADQANNQLVVKDENADLKAVHQTIGQNESDNVSKIDLNVAVKPEKTVTPVRSIDDSTGVKEVNSSDLQSGNSRELTADEMKNIKGKDWIDDAKRFVNGVVTNVINAVRPAFHIKFHSNRTDVDFEAGGHL